MKTLGLCVITLIRFAFYDGCQLTIAPVAGRYINLYTNLSLLQLSNAGSEEIQTLFIFVITFTCQC